MAVISGGCPSWQAFAPEIIHSELSRPAFDVTGIAFGGDEVSDLAKLQF
jgi:hypothetical protein